VSSHEKNHSRTRAGRRLGRRTRARGAAMIEGVIVISTMLVFMGLIVYVRKAYGTKLDLQQTTRANVLYYASHGCTGSAGTASEGTGSSDGSREAENVAKKTNVPNKAAASRKWNTASATGSETVSWQTVWDVNAQRGGAIDLQKQKLSRQINASSTVTCNEKKYDSQWKAWYQFGADFVARGFGGVGDLFK
jgi:Flp pilus assembly protein TadG